MEANATPLENNSNDINENEVRSLLEENYDIASDKIKRLDGYDDFNFHIFPPIKMTKANNYTQICLHGYVLKIMSWENSTDIEFITEYINILLHLKDQKVKCPYPIQNNKGEYKTYWRKKDISNVDKGLDPAALESLERIHVVLLFEFIPGKILNDERFGEKFCFSVGQLIGKLHQAMKPFSNSKALQRPHFLWSLKYVADSLKYAKYVQDETKRSMVTTAIENFQKEVLSQMDELEQGIIHGDLNKANFLIVENRESDPEISGIIDFSDITHSCYLFDLAITILYLTMDELDRFEEITASILSGYPREITDLEMNLLKNCICARISQSLILGLYSYHLCPSNTYLLTTQKQGWPVLEKLQNQKNENFVASIKAKMRRKNQE